MSTAPLCNDRVVAESRTSPDVSFAQMEQSPHPLIRQLRGTSARKCWSPSRTRPSDGGNSEPARCCSAPASSRRASA